MEAFTAARGEMDGTGNGVNDPTKHLFGSGPRGVATFEFLDRDGLLAGVRVSGGEWAEDSVNVLK